MPRARRLAAVLSCTTAVLVLAACSTAVPVEVAPAAADPLCAEVVLALPQELDGMPRLGTTSQATAAWGETAAPVVLRCGVDPPPPTTDRCVSADDGRTAVDWVAVPGPEQADGSTAWTFTTYGRSPAVEVLVPAEVAATRSSAFLVDLGPAVTAVEQTRACL